jgi:hypothetical protein
MIDNQTDPSKKQKKKGITSSSCEKHLDSFCSFCVCFFFSHLFKGKKKKTPESFNEKIYMLF